MGRKKLEIKRIEDKSRRLVTFSKRRAGLIKKARHLSVLCDVDVAVAVFSTGGKLYEFCSSGTNSVGRILFGYQKDGLEVEEAAINGAGEDLCIRFRTCKELLQMVNRLVGETNNGEEYSVTDMMQLEDELGAALLQIRSRKAHLMMKYISTLQEEERKSTQEKEELKQQVASANQRDAVGDGGLDVFETNQNQTNSPPKLLTLSLINE